MILFYSQTLRFFSKSEQIFHMQRLEENKKINKDPNNKSKLGIDKL